MKIKGIEILEEPFSEEYLDEVIEKENYVLTIHYPSNANLTKIIHETIEIIEERNDTVIYIHNYPKESLFTIGVKW